MRQRFVNTAFRGLLGIVLLTLPAAAQVPGSDEGTAEIRRYAVEIILFRNGTSVPTGNEQFLPDPEPDLADAGNEGLEFDDNIPEFSDVPLQDARVGEKPGVLEELAMPSISVGLQVTPRSELTMQDTYDKLELLDAYEPVLWTGWTQDAIEPARSPDIALRRLGDAPADFDGTLKLYLSRFLHLVVDLTLTERTELSRDFAFGGAPRWQTIRMTINEDRIMKNGDIRFYDHPRFGLLAKVKRIEEPEIGDEVLNATPAPGAR